MEGNTKLKAACISKATPKKPINIVIGKRGNVNGIKTV